VTGHRSQRDVLVFGAGLSLGVVPFAVMMACAGPAFAENVFRYNSLFELWGIQALLRASEALSGHVSAPMAAWFRHASDVYRHAGRYVVGIAIVVLCLYARIRARVNRYELCALSAALFLVLAPGFGVQYVVYPVAFMFAVSPWWGALYATAAGLFIGLVYHHFLVSYLPLASWHVLPYPPAYAIPATVLWAILAIFLCARLRAGTAAPDESGAPPMRPLGAPSQPRPVR